MSTDGFEGCKTYHRAKDCHIQYAALVSVRCGRLVPGRLALPKPTLRSSVRELTGSQPCSKCWPVALAEPPTICELLVELMDG